MRTRFFAAAQAAAVVALLAAAGPAAADDSASPSPSASDAPVTTAGTSFLTATNVQPGQPVQLSASTGDYLYWSFAAAAGQTDRIAVTVVLPPAASRHGAATWSGQSSTSIRASPAACCGGAVTVNGT